MRQRWIPGLVLAVSTLVTVLVSIVVNLATDRPPRFLTWAGTWAWWLLAGLTVVSLALTVAAYQADRTQSSPAPEPGPSHPASLPADVSRFVGRHAELATIRRPPGRARVVTIAGKPGVGKSALALHAAHGLIDRFPDGQLYLDLQGMSGDPLSPRSAVTQLLAALGEPTEGEQVGELAARFRTAASGRRLLLVLDDASDEEQVRDLLPGGRSCLVLVTSRRPLGGLGPAAPPILLSTFDEAECCEMLRSMAGDARIDAELEMAGSVAARCGYLPLAIRIAGARLAARPGWSVSTLAARLDDERRRLGELKVGDLDVRACIALSYVDLSNEEATTFRRLGVVPGRDFDFEVVQSVSGLPADAARRAVDALTDGQLLEVVGGERFRFHDLIRLFARELLQNDETEAAAQRLVSGYTARVRSAAEVLGVADRAPASTPVIVAAGPGSDVTPVTEAAAWCIAEKRNLTAAARLAGTLDPSLLLDAVLPLLHPADHQRQCDGSDGPGHNGRSRRQAAESPG